MAENLAVKAENTAVKAKIAALQANERLLEMRIAYLERMLYGSKSDKLVSKVPADQPGLFDGFFKEAMNRKADEIEAMARQIEEDASFS